MWNRTFTHDTPAPADAVWSVLADVAGWTQWNDGATAIELDGPVAVGTSFAMTLPDGDTITSTIVEFEPPHVITDNTELDGLAIRVQHRVSAGAGATTISYVITVTGDVPDDVAEQVGTAVSADFPQVMAALAARCEQ